MSFSSVSPLAEGTKLQTSPFSDRLPDDHLALPVGYLDATAEVASNFGRALEAIVDMAVARGDTPALATAIQERNVPYVQISVTPPEGLADNRWPFTVAALQLSYNGVLRISGFTGNDPCVRASFTRIHQDEAPALWVPTTATSGGNGTNSVEKHAAFGEAGLDYAGYRHRQHGIWRLVTAADQLAGVAADVDRLAEEGFGVRVYWNGSKAPEPSPHKERLLAYLRGLEPFKTAEGPMPRIEVAHGDEAILRPDGNVEYTRRGGQPATELDGPRGL